MKVLQMVLVGVLLTVFALPAAAQSAMARYPVQQGMAVERTTPIPQPIQTGPSVGQVLKGAVIAGLLGGRYYGGYGYGYGYYSPYGFYNPYDPWGLNRAAAGVSRSLAGGVQEYLNGGQRSMPGDIGAQYGGQQHAGPCNKKYPTDTYYINGHRGPVVIDFSLVGQKEMRKHGIKTDEDGRLTLPKGVKVCAPYPAGVDFPGWTYVADGSRDDGIAGSILRQHGLIVTEVEEGFLYTITPPQGGRE